MTSLEFSVVGSFLAGLHDAAKLREIAARFRLAGDAFTDNAARRAFEAVPLSNFESGGPEEANPNALFPNGWFRKGQAMFLTSVAGSGKSVITTQLCYGWSLGREVLGMKPFRPLTIGIIRPEDDEEEIAEFRDSMRRGFREVHDWSDKDIAEAESRVRMLNPKGKMGKEFIAYLRRVQRKYHFDLVVINPVHRRGRTGDQRLDARYAAPDADHRTGRLRAFGRQARYPAWMDESAGQEVPLSDEAHPPVAEGVPSALLARGGCGGHSGFHEVE